MNAIKRKITIARLLRIQFPGAIYHIFSRGHRKENIFLCDRDRLVFLKILIKSVEKFGVELYCFVLMNNHYHLFQKTPNPNISEAMHFINSSYSNWFKRKYNVVGSVFQGRYQAIVVDTENYALTLSAYIHLNPIRAGFTLMPENYKWSSYHYYIGTTPTPKWINTSLISTIMKGNTEEYKKFIENWNQANTAGSKINMFGESSILGNQDFKERLREIIKKKQKNADRRYILNSRAITCLTKGQIEDIFKETFQIKTNLFHNKKETNLNKQILMYGLKIFSSLSLKEISDIFDMNYVTVSQSIRRLIIRAENDLSLKKRINEFEIGIKKKIYG